MYFNLQIAATPETSLVPRLHNHTSNNIVVTFDPANLVLLMTFAGESLVMRLPETTP